MDKGPCWVPVHGVTQSDITEATQHIHKTYATYSQILSTCGHVEEHIHIHRHMYTYMYLCPSVRANDKQMAYNINNIKTTRYRLLSLCITLILVTFLSMKLPN